MPTRMDFKAQDHIISQVVVDNNGEDNSSMSTRYIDEPKKRTFEYFFNGTVIALQVMGVELNPDGFYLVTFDMLPIRWEGDKSQYDWHEYNEIGKMIILAVDHGCREFRFYP